VCKTLFLIRLSSQLQNYKIRFQSCIYLPYSGKKWEEERKPIFWAPLFQPASDIRSGAHYKAPSSETSQLIKKLSFDMRRNFSFTIVFILDSIVEHALLNKPRRDATQTANYLFSYAPL
jgi:hypothetical protein